MLSFILTEFAKLLVVGPANMVLLPVTIIKMMIGAFRRKKIKSMKTEEEERLEKLSAMIKKANKQGVFVKERYTIKGREHMGQATITKADYDPLFYQLYDVDPRKLILHAEYDGDSNVYFVNQDMLITNNK